MTTITTPLIGASLVNVVKTPSSLTAGDYDNRAPFALGSMGFSTPITQDGGLGSETQFCRIGAAGLASNAVAAVVNGITDTATATNSWVNKTGVALVEGDYAWLVSATPTVDLT